MERVKWLCMGIAAFGFAINVHAQKPIIYPAKGQTPAQQNTDDGECYTWAKQSTGIDPAVVAQAPPPPPAPTGPAVGGGERLRGALRGAAAGAVIGEIANDDAGKGAGVGAAAGVMAGGARARRNQQTEHEAQQDQAHGQQQQQIDTYYRAYGACMEGRGYTIK